MPATTSPSVTSVATVDTARSRLRSRARWPADLGPGSRLRLPVEDTPPGRGPPCRRYWRHAVAVHCNSSRLLTAFLERAVAGFDGVAVLTMLVPAARALRQNPATLLRAG